ncbi:MAG: hypothetical protein LBM70_10355 [Victivallales bacterium]|jgi:hypothetical protein|nr:hypothetical protein [Victivallales bacterium]
MKIEQQLNAIYNQIQTRLFCEKTNLVYDYLTSRDQEKRFDHLPYPDEVVADFPNPCGWGTGMEDCMLNAGSVLEICRLRNDSEACDFACRIVDGIELCSHAHNIPGFVARGITPRDGKSCYSNSSRDQFTLCVYGLWMVATSFPGIPEAYQKKARNLLVEIATYCERTITTENDYNLMRLDGKLAVVSKMIGVGSHEEQRLPMFYCAAWAVTGDTHWRDLYLARRDAAMTRAREYRAESFWWDISLSQFQLSLELLANCDKEKSGEYRQLLREIGEFSVPYLENTLAQIRAFSGDWNVLAEDWRKRPMRQEHTSHDPKRNIFTLYQGKAYLIPIQPPEFATVAGLIRATGNLLLAIALGGVKMPLTEEAVNTVLKPDFRLCGAAGGIQLSHGIYRSKSLYDHFRKP